MSVFADESVFKCFVYIQSREISRQNFLPVKYTCLLCVMVYTRQSRPIMAKWFCVWKNRGLRRDSVRRIQRWWRIISATDPITLDRIPYPPFSLVRMHTVRLYDPCALCEYICLSGDYTDPVSRIKYNDCELRRIQRASRTTIDLIRERVRHENERCERNLLEHLWIALERELDELLVQANVVSMLGSMLEIVDNMRAMDSVRCVHVLIQRMSALTSRDEYDERVVMLYSIMLQSQSFALI